MLHKCHQSGTDDAFLLVGYGYVLMDPITYSQTETSGREGTYFNVFATILNWHKW